MPYFDAIGYAGLIFIILTFFFILSLIVLLSRIFLVKIRFPNILELKLRRNYSRCLSNCVANYFYKIINKAWKKNYRAQEYMRQFV